MRKNYSKSITSCLKNTVTPFLKQCDIYYPQNDLYMRSIIYAQTALERVWLESDAYPKPDDVYGPIRWLRAAS